MAWGGRALPTSAEKGSILETSGSKALSLYAHRFKYLGSGEQKDAKNQKSRPSPKQRLPLAIEQKSESATNQSNQYMPQFIFREAMGCRGGGERTGIKGQPPPKYTCEITL